MADRQQLSVGILFLGDTNVQIRRGTAVTRAAVYAETEDGLNNPGAGSLYLSADRQYVRTAVTPTANDWRKITTSAGD